MIVMGGGTTGEELLEQLEGTKMDIKLIEKNRARCNKLSEKVNKNLILCGDGTDLEFLITGEVLTAHDVTFY